VRSAVATTPLLSSSAKAGNDNLEGLKINAVRYALAEAFRAAALDTPELDARVLIGHALGLDHTALVTAGDRVLRADEAKSIAALAMRRLGREPVARITGVKEFWSLPLRVTPDVLVPRPETETVVEAVLAVAERDRALRIVDLGVGSGAILLALLYELPLAFGVGTDRDANALGVARDNARRLGLAARAGFVLCDFGTALARGYDVVVSNPPYIPTPDIAMLAPDVRDHDPRAALDGGRDGLFAYQAIAADAARLLADGGWLAMEIGIGQDETVPLLLAAHGLEIAGAPRRDLAGQARVVVARTV